MMPNLLETILGILRGLLDQIAPDKWDKALSLISPVVSEMVSDAQDKGLGQLTPEFRAKYEVRMAGILVTAGLLEEV